MSQLTNLENINFDLKYEVELIPDESFKPKPRLMFLQAGTVTQSIIIIKTIVNIP